MRNGTWWATFLLVAAGCSQTPPPSADSTPKPAVEPAAPRPAEPEITPGGDLSLTIVHAYANDLRRAEKDEVFFWCDLKRINPTGKKISLRCQDHVVEEGLELIVTSSEGVVLGRAKYVATESIPRGLARAIPAGETLDAVFFRVSGLPPDVKVVRVQLSGELLDDEHPLPIATNVFELRVQPGLWAGMWLSARGDGTRIHLHSTSDCASGVPGLMHHLQHEDPGIREGAADWLGSIGPWAKAAVPALRAALQDTDPAVRAAAAKAIPRILETEAGVPPR